MPYLTDELVSQAEPRAGDFILWDSEVTGFGVRVTQAGSKTFVFQWRLGGRSGALRRRRIGRYGELRVDEARRMASDARRAIEHHRASDPLRSGRSTARKRKAAAEAGPAEDAASLEDRLLAYFEGRTNSRSKIMAAATRIFIRGGYNTNFEAIAQEAGVTRPTIYRYFSSKDELLREVIGAITSESIPVLSIDKERAPREALLDFARAFRAVILDERQVALFRLAMVASEHHSQVYQLATALSQRRTVDVLTRYLRWAVRTGLFRKTDPTLAAEAFMASVLGFARTNRFLGLPPRTPAQVERYLQQTIDQFLLGYLAERPAPDKAD